MAKARDYRNEYDRFQKSAKQKKNRAARNKARRKALRTGRVKKGDKKDLHHSNGIKSDKVKVMSRSKNRGMKNEGGRRKGVKHKKH